MYLVKAEMSALDEVEETTYAAEFDEIRRSRELGGFAGWIAQAFRGWGLRGLRAAQHAPRRRLVVEDSVSLGGNRRLTLVRCGGELFLAGSGTNGVHSLVRVQERAPGNDAGGANSCR